MENQLEVRAREDSSRPAMIRLVTSVLIAALVTTYLVWLVSVGIPDDHRLSATDLGLVAVAGMVIVILLNPTFLERLSLVKLPGGVEMTLREIERKQEKQQSELNDVRFMLTYLLSVAEHAHLQALAIGKADDYAVFSPLREELRKLKRLGLLEELPGQTLDEVRDGEHIDLKRYFKLTGRASEYLKALGDLAV